MIATPKRDRASTAVSRALPVDAPVIMYLDLGSSLTKGFGLFNGAIEPVLMGSRVSESLTPLQLESSRSFATASLSEYSAWVELGEEIRAVGLFAENFGHATHQATEPKESRALYKILAALGVMKTRLLPDNPANPIHLGVLLPYSEFGARKDLFQQLMQIPEFKFKGMPYSLQFNDIQFRPEGVGLCLARIKELQQAGISVADRTLIVLMCGHRNTSVLVFQGDAFQPGKSNSVGPGFMEAVDTAASVLGFHQPSDKSKLLDAFVSQGQVKRVALSGGKVVDASSAIASGLSSYWGSLEAYLNAYLTPHLGSRTEIVIGGGAADQVSGQLASYLELVGIPPERWTAYRNSNLHSILNEQLGEGEAIHLHSRCGDVYLAFNNLVSLVMGVKPGSGASHGQ